MSVELLPNMHHPDIYEIIAIIEDYFVLVEEDEHKCRIEPAIYLKPASREKPKEDITERKGLRISRRLNNGRIEVNIFSSYKDGDCMDVQYRSDKSDSLPVVVADESNRNFLASTVRDAIRKTVILDRDMKVKAENF